MGLPDEAINWLGQAIHESAAPPLAHFHLAAAYLAIGDMTRAEEHWQLVQARRLNTDGLDGNERKAWVMLEARLNTNEDRL